MRRTCSLTNNIRSRLLYKLIRIEDVCHFSQLAKLKSTYIRQTSLLNVWLQTRKTNVKLTSSRHCFWHIWQYHLNFWRPLDLILLLIALGLRKSAFPISYLRRLTNNLFFSWCLYQVKWIFRTFCILLWLCWLSFGVCIMRHRFESTATIARNSSCFTLFAPALSGQSDLHTSEHVRQDQRGCVPPTMVMFDFIDNLT